MRTVALALSLAVIAAIGVAGPASAAFPGSGNKVQYSERTSGSSFDLRAIGVSGSTSLIHDGGASSFFSGGYSPNGNKVIFFGNVGGDYEIWIADADGGDAHAITTNAVQDRDPSWSPDGDQIVFARSGDLAVMDKDGSNFSVIRPSFNAVRPVWSPNGKRIAFTEDTGSSDDILSIKPDGSGEKVLAHSDTGEVIGDYSPDGKHIVYHRSYGSGANAIFRMNSDGTKRKVFIEAGGADLFFPRYSSNGNNLLYNRDSGGAADIWIARASDGKQRDELLATSDDNYLFIQD